MNLQQDRGLLLSSEKIPKTALHIFAAAREKERFNYKVVAAVRTR